MATVELRAIKKSYDKVNVIHGVDLQINSGEFVVFVGPSGCGKSTLLRLIAGLEEISSGTLSVDGRDITRTPPTDRGIAMVFQSYALYPNMTVRGNLRYPLEVAKMSKQDIEQQVNSTAAVLQLTELLDRLPRALSGGQRQRVAIGRAIIRKPQIFLFDEPLSNLDAELRLQMRIEIARLHETLGNTMIYVTHDQLEAMTLADRIVVLRQGRIEQVGTPLDLYHDPDNVFVAGFIGSPKINFIPATVIDVGPDGVRLAVPMLGLENLVVAVSSTLTSGQEVVLGIRPEHFLAAESSPVQFSGVLSFAERLGHTNYLYLQTDREAPLVIEQRAFSPMGHGECITLGIDPALCLLFSTDGLRIR